MTRAGRTLDVDLSMYTVQWIEQNAWLIVAHDVTAQRTLELCNQAMEASHNGMFICSAREADGAISYVNAAMAEFSGQDRDALIGRPFLDLFPRETVRDAEHLMSALRAGRRADVVTMFYENDSAMRWLEA